MQLAMFAPDLGRGAKAPEPLTFWEAVRRLRACKWIVHRVPDRQHRLRRKAERGRRASDLLLTTDELLLLAQAAQGTTA